MRAQKIAFPPRSDVQARLDALEHVERALHAPLLALSIVYVVILIAPMVTPLSPAQQAALRYSDWTIWALFALEFAVRLHISPYKRSFLRNNLVDLLIVAVPFLRPFRVLRVAVMLRSFSLLAVSTRSLRAMAQRYKLNYVLLVAILWILVSASLVLVFERRAPDGNIKSFSDALWWAFVTVFTVGYGDKYPVTAEGRGVAIALMGVGLGLSGLTAGIVASYFVKQSPPPPDDRIAVLNGRLEHIEQMLTQLTQRSPGLVESAAEETCH